MKLISECFVKPKIEIEAAKKPYHLGPCDIAFLTIDPIQKGLLYKLDYDNNNSIDRATKISNLLENLKHSLAIALVHFYPLAGRFTTHVLAEENASSVFIDCNKGPGARFIHASAMDLGVYDVLSPYDVTIVRPFFELGEIFVNYDGHTRALVSIQVTELLDGVFIGFTMNHCVVDGTSFIHFINMLSEIFTTCNSSVTNCFLNFSPNCESFLNNMKRAIKNGDSTNESNVMKISRVPIFNYRPWLNYNEWDDDDVRVKFPYLSVESLVNRDYDPGPLKERVFHFSHASIAKLKAKVNNECGPIDSGVISSFQAVTVLVWKSITQARNLPIDGPTSCFMAIGTRTRFEPPVSEDYFGNFLSIAKWGCKVEELLGNNLGWAAMKLKEILKAQDEKAILEMCKLFTQPIYRPRGTGPNFHGENCVIMGGSSRFDMYGPEFGLGRALAALMGFGNKEDGKVTANQGCEGGGSLDLEICLRPQTMAALEANQKFMSFVSFE